MCVCIYVCVYVYDLHAFEQQLALHQQVTTSIVIVVYICTYIYIYIYSSNRTNVVYIYVRIRPPRLRATASSSPAGDITTYPLPKKNYFEAFVHELIVRLLPPPTCIALTIAILLHVHCALYDAPPTPLVYTIHRTVLVMAISCKGQITISIVKVVYICTYTTSTRSSNS